MKKILEYYVLKNKNNEYLMNSNTNSFTSNINMSLKFKNKIIDPKISKDLSIYKISLIEEEDI